MNTTRFKIITLLLITTTISCFYLKSTIVTQNNTKQTQTDEEIISAIMNYPIPHMIDRCKKDFNYSDEDMVILERELKRYLALCAVKNNADLSIGMYSRDVDNLWHSFILFTKDYANFCDKTAGYFLHHLPRTDFTPEPWEKIVKDFRVFIDQYEKTFKEEPHPIWFLDMCES